MKTGMKVHFYALFIIAFLGLLCVRALAVDDYPRESSDLFAYTEILKAVERDGDQSSWNTSTTWYEVIPLYDCYDVCNGYIYKLMTNGKESGYIQINRIDGIESLACYSYVGEPVHEIMMKSSDLPESLGTNGHLYFFGNMTYCVRDKNNYVLLSDFSRYDQSTVQSHYEEFIKGFKSKAEEMEKTPEQKDSHLLIVIVAWVIAVSLILSMILLRKTYRKLE